jgi:hypothetical protein
MGWVFAGNHFSMEAFIDTQAAQELIGYAATGFVVMMICSLVYALVMIRIIQGRLITFTAMAWGMFFTFCILFYGLNFLARHVWQIDQALGEPLLNALAFAIGFAAVVFEAFCLKILFSEGKSLLAEEFDQLPESQWSPLDAKRKAHFAHHKRR